MPDTFDAPLIVADAQGRRFINREKLGENWYVLRLDDYPLSVSASSAAMSGFSIPEDAGHAGDFEIAGIVGFGTAPFRLTLDEVGTEANSYQNNPIHHNLMVGLGGLPFVLAETAFLLAGKLIRVQVTNLSTTLTNSVRLALVGRRFSNDMAPEVRERRAQYLASRPTRPFFLTLDQTTAAIGAGSTNQEFFLTMPSGSHFAVDDVLYESTWPFEFSLFDGQTGRALTFGQGGGGGGFVDCRMVGGSGALPARTLGSPLVQPRRGFRVLFNDLGNNGTNTIHFTFHGRRLRLPVG